jgi:diaminopimelate epimerase
MTLRFTKMHGLGNDFMVVEAQTDERLPDTSTWRKLADRHTGFGFDQALVSPTRRGGVLQNFQC